MPPNIHLTEVKIKGSIYLRPSFCAAKENPQTSAATNKNKFPFALCLMF